MSLAERLAISTEGGKASEIQYTFIRVRDYAERLRPDARWCSPNPSEPPHSRVGSDHHCVSSLSPWTVGILTKIFRRPGMKQVSTCGCGESSTAAHGHDDFWMFLLRQSVRLMSGQPGRGLRSSIVLSSLITMFRPSRTGSRYAVTDIATAPGLEPEQRIDKEVWRRDLGLTRLQLGIPPFQRRGRSVIPWSSVFSVRAWPHLLDPSICKGFMDQI